MHRKTREINMGHIAGLILLGLLATALLMGLAWTQGPALPASAQYTGTAWQTDTAVLMAEDVAGIYP